MYTNKHRRSYFLIRRRVAVNNLHTKSSTYYVGSSLRCTMSYDKRSTHTRNKKKVYTHGRFLMETPNFRGRFSGRFVRPTMLYDNRNYTHTCVGSSHPNVLRPAHTWENIIPTLNTHTRTRILCNRPTIIC